MLNDANTAFANRLTTAGIMTRPASDAYLEDMRGNYKGQGQIVALPDTTEEVATIVRQCGQARVGLVPYGGGTGLVAGQISIDGPLPLILSLEKMTAIRATYPDESTMIVEAGVTLADVQTAADDIGRLFPLSYGSKDSARIGGGLAVNSGGLNVLRYGMARELCLGLEAVLPNGDIFHGLKRLRKDNTGYDLRHLLIGSEGTLGVITAAALRLSPKPAHTATAFLTVKDPTAALTLLSLFRDRAGDVVSAFELIPAQSFLFLTEALPDLRQPFETPPDWSVLVELGTSAASDPQSLMTDVFEAALDAGLVTDGRIAQGEQQRNDFWTLRENIPEANRRIGAIASHDIALPLSEVADFITDARTAIQAILPARINAFGHLGDGNLHFNVFPPQGENRDDWRHHRAEVTKLVHDMTMARGGTFSAEHGIGRFKKAELATRGDPAKLAAMRAIKTALDPLGIMNPGAVL